MAGSTLLEGNRPKLGGTLDRRPFRIDYVSGMPAVSGGRAHVIELKGCLRQTPGMQKATRLTAAQRNRALGRLRSFTVGTALASAAATGAFGYLAVTTNPGTQVTDTTSGTTTTADSQSTTTSDSGSGTTSSTATTSPVATPGLQSSTSGITTTRHRAHVTTGGS